MERTKAIDAVFYPHIIDSIFVFADREALFALRRVSKVFKRCADVILAHHIAFRFVENDDIIWGTCFEEVAGDMAVPGLPGLDDEWDKADDAQAGYREHLQLVRVLDTDLWQVPPHDVDADFTFDAFRGLVNVHTLRHKGAGNDGIAWAGDVPSKVVIFFITLDSPRINFPGLSRTIPTGPVTHGVEKMVFHIQDHELETIETDAELGTSPWPHSLRHVVFIFTAPTKRDYGTALPAGSLARRAQHPQELGILWRILPIMAVTIPDIKFTFVDMHIADPKLFGLPTEEGRTNVQLKSILARALVNVKTGSRVQDRTRIAETVSQCLSLCTLDEYRSTLPPDDFALEVDKCYESDFFARRDWK